MSRSANVGSAVAAAAALTIGTPAMAGPADLSAKTVVLVHGAFADGSSWAKVIPRLRARGLHVVAVQNPLTSLKADVDATQRAIDQVDGPVILVGHSYGGVVITDAGNSPKVKAMVYVAAFAPDSGQSITSMTKGAPPPAYAPFLRKDSGGFFTLTEEGIRKNFATDLPPAEQELIATVQVPWASEAPNTAVGQAAWHGRPTYTVISTNDGMIPPPFQEQMAKTAHAKVTRVAASHVVMLSHPKEVADVIIEAAIEAK